MKRKITFTLSEVLITLVIVGIVAAITVPLIYTSYQKEATVQKLKKSYAAVCDLVKLSELDNGPLATWEFDSTYNSYGVNSDFFKKYFEPYIITSKKYGAHSPDRVSYPVNNIDGQTANNILVWYVLADGTGLTMFSNGTYYCWILIDINASNPPNRLGKDIFMLDIYRNGKVRFWGDTYNNFINVFGYACKKGSGYQYAGGSCGAWIQAAGWKIPNGYPW